MSYPVKLSESLSLVATIDPNFIAAGGAAVYTDVVNMAEHRRAIVVLLEGPAVATKRALTACTLEIFECTASGTAASTALKSTTITRAQTTAAMGQQRVLSVRDEELGTVHAAYNQYFKAKLTPAAATSAINFAVVVLAGESRFSKASEYDLSTNTIV